MKNVVIIFAKVGSIGLPGKNTWVVGNKTLLEWTIEDARKNKLVDEVFVSTNGEEVAAVARKAGAKVISRANDLAKNENFLGAVDHAVQQVKRDNPDLELIAIPQCVVPFRDPDIFDRCFSFLTENPEFDSAVTIRPTAFIPEATMRINKEGDLVPYFPETQGKASPSRQDSAGYEIDHAVESFRYRSWQNRANGIKPWDYIGRKVKGIRQTFHNPNCFVDVHTPNDIQWLEFLYKNLGYQGMKNAEKEEVHG